MRILDFWKNFENVSLHFSVFLILTIFHFLVSDIAQLSPKSVHFLNCRVNLKGKQTFCKIIPRSINVKSRRQDQVSSLKQCDNNGMVLCKIIFNIVVYRLKISP